MTTFKAKDTCPNMQALYFVSANIKADIPIKPLKSK